ncbi:hypothetical protein [Acidovorax sp. RAC01]|nr:hypothetical protein [Acidovorax sp. RAC01]
MRTGLEKINITLVRWHAIRQLALAIGQLGLTHLIPRKFTIIEMVPLCV